MRRGDALDRGSFGILPYAGWAWESLRRNPDYRQEYFSKANHYHNQFKLKAGGDIVRLRRLHIGARKWGLCFFENPELCANHAQVFWDPSVYSRTLKVRVQNGSHGDKFTDGLNYVDADVRKTILDLPDGRRHIRLFAKGIWVQLRTWDRFVISHDSNVEIQLRRKNTAGDRLATFQELLAIFDDENPVDASRQIPTNSRNLRRYLSAYDIKMSGGSYRDIAIALEGRQRVEDDWHPGTRHLKDRAKRAFRSGQKLVGGGYLDLLSDTPYRRVES